MRRLDHIAKRIVAYPLLAIGLALTVIAEGFVRAAAWLMDVNPDEEFR